MYLVKIPYFCTYSLIPFFHSRMGMAHALSGHVVRRIGPSFVSLKAVMEEKRA